MSSPHWEGAVEVYGVSFSSKEVLPLVACEFILDVPSIFLGFDCCYEKGPGDGEVGEYMI